MSGATKLNGAAAARVKRARQAATTALEAVSAARKLADLAQVLDGQPKAPVKGSGPQVRLLKVDQLRLRTCVEQLTRIHGQLEADARKVEAWELGGRIDG